MSDVQVIKANKSENRFRGRKVEILRVAAYCRVSTDSEDQLNSYKSQVMYYTDLIKKKHDWSLVDIYADEAITGTQVTKREDFQRMINDCMNGDIDMVITKSISRFARNTLDTLKYVRMLKEKGIAVFFEDENINTLTMDGELLLVVLSSVAQQEVENISSNVKKGLKMKMKRGELVGFQGCLGYDYHKETKSISVNEKEAEIVRYIFNRYIEGAGCTVIANELENLGYKTKYGSSRWVQSTVIGIIKNEKYKGDLLLGKTFTVDPISKRRLENFGEEDKFYIQNHHEPIVSEEVFEEAQKILAKRNVNRGVHQDGQKRNKFSRKYAFSCMIKCGFCGGTLTRRNWHSSSAYTKTIWQCVTATKQGKKYCPHCKGIPEEVIEKAFVKSYQLLCSDQQQVVEEFLQKVEGVLNEDTSLKRLPKIEKEMNDLRKRKEKLLDLRLDTTIDRDIYESKNRELSEQLKKLQEEQEQLLELSKNRENTRTRLREFRKNLSSGEILEDFDRVVFESVVEKIIIGGYNKEGVEEPLKITFVYKTGIHSNFNGKDFKPKRRNAAALHSDAELCSYASDEAAELCSHSSNDTHGLRIHDGLFQYYDGQGWVDTKVGAFEGQSSTWKNQVVLQFAGTMRVEKVLESSYFKIQEKGDTRSSSLAPFIDSSYPYQGVQYAIYATTNQKVYVWHVQKDINEDYGVSVERLYPVDDAENDVILRVESGKGMPVLICESNAEDVVEVVHMEYIESDLSTNRRITALEELEQRGTWTPVLYVTPSTVAPTYTVLAQYGSYIRHGDYVWIEGMIITSSNYACYKIGGLPFAPNSDRPAMLCPVAVVNGENFKVSSLNKISESGTENELYNNDYNAGTTPASWYISGFYKIK